MTTRIGKLSYDPSAILGQGNFGTVFAGFHRENLFISKIFGGKKPVAVKRVQKTQFNETAIQQELVVMQNIGNHPNILQYICTEMNPDFM